MEPGEGGKPEHHYISIPAEDPQPRQQQGETDQPGGHGAAPVELVGGTPPTSPAPQPAPPPTPAPQARQEELEDTPPGKRPDMQQGEVRQGVGRALLTIPEAQQEGQGAGEAGAVPPPQQQQQPPSHAEQPTPAGVQWYDNTAAAGEAEEQGEGGTPADDVPVWIEQPEAGWAGPPGTAEQVDTPGRHPPGQHTAPPLPLPSPTDEDEDAFFGLLEEMAVGSNAEWAVVREALEWHAAQDARYCGVMPSHREFLFNRYRDLQAELERQVELLSGKAWPELQAEATATSILGLHSEQLALLPASVGQLGGLLMLNLRDCATLQRLPGSLGLLGSLQFLELSGCAQLRSLPPSQGTLAALQTIDLSGCAALTELPSELGMLTALQTLDLSRCTSLEHLPSTLGTLGALQTLNLSGCAALRRLPATLGQLKSLQALDVSDCAALQSLPADLGQLGSLYALELRDCVSLAELPLSIGQLKGLLNLVLSGCTALEELPASLGQLASLQRLYLARCSSLQRLPATLGQLKALQALDVSHCTALRVLPYGLGQLSGLLTLNLDGCTELEDLPDLSGCPDLELSMSDTGPDGQPVKLRRIRVPIDCLPPRLARRSPEILLGQAEALRQSTVCMLWVAILLATASFLCFVIVPAGYLPRGQSAVALRGTQTNRTALRMYFIANICTFFTALSTAMFIATENMPHATPPTAGRVLASIATSTVMLLVTVSAGATTVMSSVFATYPRSRYSDIIPPAAAAGSVLLLVFWWFTRRVWGLFFRWRRLRAAAPIPNILVTGSSHGNTAANIEKALKSILLAR